MAYYFMVEKRKGEYVALNISNSIYFKSSNQTQKYKKGCAHTLKEIDNFTMMFNNEEELRKALIEENILPIELGNKALSTRCLNKNTYNKVPYDFLYQKDLEYVLDPTLLVKKIMERYFQNDFVFIKKLAEHFQGYRECSSTAADIRQWSEISIRENYRYRHLDDRDKNGDLQVARLLKLLILKHYERFDGTIDYKNEINHRNLHSIIAFMNNYDKKLEITETKTNKEATPVKEIRQKAVSSMRSSRDDDSPKMEFNPKIKTRKKIYEIEGQLKLF